MPTMHIHLRTGATVSADTTDQSAIDSIISNWLSRHNDPTATENEVTPPSFDKTIVYRMSDVVAIVSEP